ncbi:DUF6894 family protein [Sphingopyxis panaciterrae]
MGRYFFHTTDGTAERDEMGFDLPDDDAARREAVRFGGGLLSDDPDMIRNDKGLRIDVIDEAGRLCFAVIVLAVEANRNESARA